MIKFIIINVYHIIEGEGLLNAKADPCAGLKAPHAHSVTTQQGLANRAADQTVP